MLRTKDATKYLTEAIPKTFPNANIMPVTANEIKSILHSLKSKKIHVVIMKYEGCPESKGRLAIKKNKQNKNKNN
jgi:hypothetical protein